jgi:hypothetical protein
VFEGKGDKFIIVKAKRITKIPIETKSSIRVYPGGPAGKELFMSSFIFVSED